MGESVVWQIGRVNTGPSLELLCSGVREGQTRLVHWL